MHQDMSALRGSQTARCRVSISCSRAAAEQCAEIMICSSPKVWRQWLHKINTRILFSKPIISKYMWEEMSSIDNTQVWLRSRQLFLQSTAPNPTVCFLWSGTKSKSKLPQHRSAEFKRKAELMIKGKNIKQKNVPPGQLLGNDASLQQVPKPCVENV